MTFHVLDLSDLSTHTRTISALFPVSLRIPHYPYSLTNLIHQPRHTTLFERPNRHVYQPIILAMFQTFTGASRKPRNVNLSGRTNNPFAAIISSQIPTAPTSSQNAIAHAQQERRARQQERERLQAAKTLQRTWRGHKSRKEVKSRYRQEWDYRERVAAGDATGRVRGYRTEEEALEQLRLLGQFASPRDGEDILRIRRCAENILAMDPLSIEHLASQHRWRYPLTRVAQVVARMLEQKNRKDSISEDTAEILLKFLTKIARGTVGEMAWDADFYYGAFRSFLETSDFLRLAGSGRFGPLIKDAVLALLKSGNDSGTSAYEGFAHEILTIPQLSDYLDFGTLAKSLDSEMLTKALNRLLSSEVGGRQIKSRSKEQLLWLLTHYIVIHRLGTADRTASKRPDSDYITVVSSLLSQLAEEISSRMSGSPNPLPVFVESEISSLLNQESIASLLAYTSFDSLQKNSGQESGDAAVLASYALTLLRIFPRRGDEIRMWLYLGSTARQSSANRPDKRVPAIKYFWNAVTRTELFTEISEHPRKAISWLQAEGGSSGYKTPLPSNRVREREWRVLLLFLELYTFVLKVMDDEEFMTGADDTQISQSWTRQSALRLGQVKGLTVFLKNLAFAMYWNASDILGTRETQATTSLAEYFKTSGVRLSVPEPETTGKKEDLEIAGISGMSLDYTRDTVTGLLRMIYEREWASSVVYRACLMLTFLSSRRSFLPKDHWLMTKYFDMSGFIPAVVQEESYRHQAEDGEDESEDILDLAEDDNDEEGMVGTQRTQQVRRIERLKRQQRKASRRKQLEAVTPRLEILQNMPFFIPFVTRVEIFREFVYVDQMRRRNGYIDADQWRMSIVHGTSAFSMRSREQAHEDLSKHHAKVRRDHTFEDAFEKFYELGEGFKEPIQITFVDQFDTEEAGIDGGGVTKEFLTSVTNEAFATTVGPNLFVENDQHLLYPNPSAVDERKDLLRQIGYEDGSPVWNEQIRDLLQRYEFLGRVVGKCLYEGILIDIHFAPFFLVKWALTGGSGSATNESGYRANINDLRDLDESLYQGLVSRLPITLFSKIRLD